ncbi:MAG: hypothetical protein L0Z49_11440 [Actinobacteria bacterium]|nr:hypothetical protein [Actinomycetota bacterium]
MTLRTKLAISFTVLLLAATAAIGLVASASIRGILVDQIDQSLLSFADFRGSDPAGARRGPHHRARSSRRRYQRDADSHRGGGGA